MRRSPPTRAIAFERLRDEMLALYLPPLRAKATYLKMRQVLELVADLEVRTTDDLTPQLIGRFIASRPRRQSPNTTRSLLMSLRAACNYAVAMGYLERSPFAARRGWVRRARPTRRQHHTLREIADVLELLRLDVAACRGWRRWRARRLHALVATFAYSGMRKQEVLHLRAEDLDFDRGLILIEERDDFRPKTEDSAQPVPMAPDLAAILKSWLSHVEDSPRGARTPWGGWSGWPEGGPRWVFPTIALDRPWLYGPAGEKALDQCKAAGRRAGVEGLTFQSLRHSWATHAEAWGLSPAMIQRVLRHTSLDTQWHYRHADLANLSAVAGAINFGAAGVPPDGGPSTLGPDDPVDRPVPTG